MFLAEENLLDTSASRRRSPYENTAGKTGMNEQDKQHEITLINEKMYKLFNDHNKYSESLTRTGTTKKLKINYDVNTFVNHVWSRMI